MASTFAVSATSSASTDSGTTVGVWPEVPVDPDIIWKPEVVARVATLVIIMAATVVGNASLIAGIACNPSLRRRRVSVFLVNLAIGDLMVCVVTMTTEILFVAFGQWVLGPTACKLSVYGQIVTLASTTFLLTAMSIDSYQVLVEPLRSLRTGRPSISRKVIAAWTLAFVFATPQLFIFVETTKKIDDGRRNFSFFDEDNLQRPQPPPPQTIRLCQSRGYTAEWQRKVYFSFLTTYILVIPTVVMTFCYLNIIRAVWTRAADAVGLNGPRVHFISARRSRSTSQDDHQSVEADPTSKIRLPVPTFPQPPSPNRRIVVRIQNGGSSIKNNNSYVTVAGCDQSTIRLSHQGRASQPTFSALPKRLMTSSKRHVVRMTLSVIVGFVVCWSPYFVVSLIRIFTDYRILLTNLLSACELLALLHSALNPLLYGLFSLRAVRSSVDEWCARRRRRHRRHTSADNDGPCSCLLLVRCRPGVGQAVSDFSPDYPAMPCTTPSAARAPIDFRPGVEWRLSRPTASGTSHSSLVRPRSQPNDCSGGPSFATTNCRTLAVSSTTRIEDSGHVIKSTRFLSTHCYRGDLIGGEGAPTVCRYRDRRRNSACGDSRDDVGRRPFSLPVSCRTHYGSMTQCVTMMNLSAAAAASRTEITDNTDAVSLSFSVDKTQQSVSSKASLTTAGARRRSSACAYETVSVGSGDDV